MILRIKRSHIILTVFAILIIAITAFILKHIYFGDSGESVSTTAEDEAQRDKALIYLLIDKIQKESDDFYVEFYTINPIISNYSTTVKEVKEVGPNLYITFTTLPYIGPHDTIGEDEITFSLNSSGEATPIGLKHLKNYSLPDNLAHILREALPPISE